MNKDSLLQWAVENNIDIYQFKEESGNIDYASLQECYDMNERKKYLKLHGHAIGQMPDGRWYTRIKDDKTGTTKTVIKPTQKQLEDVIVQYLRTQEQNPTLQEIFFWHLDESFSKGKISQGTKNRDTYDYFKYYMEFGEKRIKDIKPKEVARFIENVFYTEKLDNKQYDRFTGIMKAIIKYSFREEYIIYTYDSVKNNLDITKKEIAKHKKHKDIPVFTKEEQKKIITYCSESENILDKAILVCLYTGLRRGELCALTWDNVSHDKITVNAEEITYKDDAGHKHTEVIHGQAKTYSSLRTFLAHPQAVNILEELRQTATSEYVFAKSGNRVASESVYKRLKRVCNYIGIPYRSLHSLRKTFISECIAQGMPLALIQSIVGHSKASTTLNYYTFNVSTDQELSNYYLALMAA